MYSLNKIAQKFKQTLKAIVQINQRFDELKINQGSILTSLHTQSSSKNLQDYEFKIFSQWGEDGIIQHLIKNIEIKNKTFIEFGVEDFFEANCRFLMMKDNWSGLVIDGSESNIKKLKNSYFYWKHDITALEKFITRENIENILAQSGFDKDLGILSIDLDGIDYYILESINNYKPRILICEYNAVFGPTRKITVPYQENFYRTHAHHSNLFGGASLAAMTYLANKKGYSLIGTNSASNNAFYVRNDLLNDKLQVMSVEEAYTQSKFRESRDKHGNLTYIALDKRLDVIKGMKVFEVEKEVIEEL